MIILRFKRILRIYWYNFNRINMYTYQHNVSIVYKSIAPMLVAMVSATHIASPQFNMNRTWGDSIWSAKWGSIEENTTTNTIHRTNPAIDCANLRGLSTCIRILVEIATQHGTRPTTYPMQVLNDNDLNINLAPHKINVIALEIHGRGRCARGMLATIPHDHTPFLPPVQGIPTGRKTWIVT